MYKNEEAFIPKLKNLTANIEFSGGYLKRFDYEESSFLNEKIEKEEEDKETLFHESVLRYNLPNYFYFGIYNYSDELVGYLALTPVNHIPEVTYYTYNLEYYILEDYRKMGYCFNACKALINSAFSSSLQTLVQDKENIYRDITEIAKVSMIRLWIDEKNIASYNCAKKLGFNYEGIINRVKEDSNIIKSHAFYLYNNNSEVSD